VCGEKSLATEISRATFDHMLGRYRCDAMTGNVKKRSPFYGWAVVGMAKFTAYRSLLHLDLFLA